MSMIEIIETVRELDALGVILILDTDEHLAEALTEIGVDDDN